MPIDTKKNRTSNPNNNDSRLFRNLLINGDHRFLSDTRQQPYLFNNLPGRITKQHLEGRTGLPILIIGGLLYHVMIALSLSLFP
ncbi:MAG: hypothetical protein LWW75_02710 [Chlorobiales bacterium]|nr:hypothetical protein [Chlorobiales bacterium]